MIQFTVDEKLKIVRLRYTGEIKLEDYTTLFGQLIESNSQAPFPKKFLVLSDYREAQVKIQPAQMGQIWALMEQHFHMIEKIKEALLHKSPYETALSEMAANEAHDERYEMKIFAKENNAINWLIS